MSINDIMKYVNKTPGNTNPSVIASMVKGEMNDTLKEAKEYTDNAFRELGIDKETKKTTYSGTLEVYGEVSTHIQTGKVFGLVAGNTYTITLDSGTYTAVAKSDGNGGVYFGNDSAMGGEDTGETYCVGEILVTTDTWQTGVTDLNCGTKYTITTETETIHPIDPKFLPGVCLPVVDLTGLGLPTTIGDMGPIEDETVITVLNQNMESPGFIVRTIINNDGDITEFCVHLTRMKVGKVVQFIGTALICDIMLGSDDTGWFYHLL